MPAPHGLILYATKYGSTREYAHFLAEGLAAPAVQAEDFTADLLEDRSLVVVGSPIYGFRVLPAMESLLERFGKRLAGKTLAAFVVCGDTLRIPRTREGGPVNLVKLTRLLPAEPAATAIFGGRMRLDELDAGDREQIMTFYAALGRAPAGFERMDLKPVSDFIERIRLAALKD